MIDFDWGATDNDRMGESIASRIGAFFLDMIETIVIALSIFLVIYLFLVQPHQVSGLSMFPNFHDKEYILTDKVSYKFGEPKRGDVVVFHAPEAAHCPKGTGCDFIKRVIAVPGETLEIRNHTFYINGQELPEPYIPEENVLNPGSYLEEGRVVTLQENEYFVVGDNRPHSSDSRAWGPIGMEHIIGKGFFRYWPIDRVGLLPTVSYPF